MWERSWLNWAAGRLGQGAPADSLCFLSRMCWCRHASQLPGRLQQPLSLHLPIMHTVPRLLGRGASCMACQDAGHSHQLPLGSPNRGWRKRVTATVRLTITSRTGSALPACFSNRPHFWTTLTERAIQQLDSYMAGPVGRWDHLLSCSTDMLPVSHLFHPHCPQKSPQYSEELWQMKQTGRRKKENWLLAWPTAAQTK